MDDRPIELPRPPPALAVKLALGLRGALLRAADAVVPPQVAVLELLTGVGATNLLGAAARFRFADHLAEGPLSADELARRAGLDAAATERSLRALASRGIFARGADGRWRNTRLSKALRSGVVASMRDFADYMASKSNLDAWTDFRATLKSGKNAFERVHGMSVWDWFDQHPDEREVFAGGMLALTQLDAPSVARTYPFAELKRVCDVGGGRGTLLSEILRTHAHLSGVLCDAPGVLELARPFLARQGVAARVELAPGSFFERVPEGADAYILKDILHDWDDARSLAILRNCRKAMAPGAKVLVCEVPVERDTTNGFGPLVDAHMMVVCSDGGQRGRGDFARLFEQSGFRLGRFLPTPTPIHVIEGVAV